MKIRRLTTTSKVIEACGGNVAFRELTGRTKQQVSNYRACGRFPPQLFLVVSAALMLAGAFAPPSLFGIAAPPRGLMAGSNDGRMLRRVLALSRVA